MLTSKAKYALRAMIDLAHQTGNGPRRPFFIGDIAQRQDIPRRFLENILPLGSFRDMLSGGLMLVENAGVGFAVAGGFGSLFLEFLEETRAVESESGP